MRVGLHLHILKGKLLRFKLLDSTVVSEWHLSQRPLRTGHASQNLILRGDLENVERVLALGALPNWGDSDSDPSR